MGNIDVVTIDVLACIKSFIFKPPNSHCGCIIVILVVNITSIYILGVMLS